MERQEKIKKLAETLERSGLAVNPTEALRKAEDIVITEESLHMSIKEKGINEKEAIKKNIDIDNIDTQNNDITVMELIKEAEKPMEKDLKAEPPPQQQPINNQNTPQEQPIDLEENKEEE